MFPMVAVNRAGEILFERIHGAGVDGECEDEDEQQLHGGDFGGGWAGGKE